MIDVYDSLLPSTNTAGSASLWLTRQRQLTPLRRILPPLLDAVGFWRDKLDERRHSMFAVHLPKDQFYQEDITNCGAFALKYIETILEGTVIEQPKMTGSQIAKYRKEIAFSIFLHSEDKTAFDIDMQAHKG